MGTRELLSEYEQLKWKREVAKKADSEDSKRMEQIESLLLDAMVEIGTDQLKTESGMTLYKVKQFYVSIPPENKQALVQELIRTDENGNPQYPGLIDLVEIQVPTGKLKSVLKEMEGLEGGIPEAVAALLKISRPIEVQARGGKNPNLQNQGDGSEG